MDIAFTVKLKKPFEHNGEMIEEIGFRELIASDIASDKVSFNDLSTAHEKENIDLIYKSGLKLAKCLAIKPKLGDNAANLPLGEISLIMERWGEYFESVNTAPKSNGDGGENADAPNPLPSSQKEALE